MKNMKPDWDFVPRPATLRHNHLGQEIADQTEIEPPLGFIDQPSLHEQIRAAVISEQLRLAAEAEGFESFEDADDFDVGDDYDPTSPYEEQFNPPPPPIDTAPPYPNVPHAPAKTSPEPEEPKSS